MALAIGMCMRGFGLIDLFDLLSLCRSWLGVR